MANSRRTYQWVDGQIREYRRPPDRTYFVENSERARPFIAVPPKETVGKSAMGVQDALLIFTLSSLGLVFAGGGLFAFCFVAYAIFFR